MSISGLELLENVTLQIDERMYRLKAESIKNFCKHHGISKETVKLMIRQFLIPGRRIMDIWTADREQLDEFFEIVSKWGADYSPDKHKKLTKPVRMQKMKEDLNRSKKGEYRCKRPWSSFG